VKMLCLALLLVAASMCADAREAGIPEDAVLRAGYLYHHPDLKHRLLGMHAFEEGRIAEAMAEFRRSARWADKVSQAMVAEMLWEGTAGARDPVAAYAWMDLSAERGYRVFVAKREQYWAALDDEQRRSALELGQVLYSEYGDDVARPRLESRLQQGRRLITGSRVGFVGPLKIHYRGGDIGGDVFYQDKYWHPARYFEWQDRVLSAPPTGTVEIGPLADGAGTHEYSAKP